MTRSLQIVVMAAAAVLLSSGGFVAGMTVGSGGAKTDAAASASASAASAAAARRGGGPGGNGQLGQISGRVLSVGDGSITIEARQPGSSDAPRSVIALVGGNARVVRSTETEIKASEIKTGDQVLVVGQPDPQTGVVSANAVVVGINSLQQVFGGSGGGAAPSGSGAPRRVTPSPTPTR